MFYAAKSKTVPKNEKFETSTLNNLLINLYLQCQVGKLKFLSTEILMSMTNIQLQ